MTSMGRSTTPTREKYARSFSMSEKGSIHPPTPPNVLSPSTSHTDLHSASEGNLKVSSTVHRLQHQAKRAVGMFDKDSSNGDAQMSVEDRRLQNLRIFELGQFDRRDMLKQIGKGPVLNSSSRAATETPPSSPSPNGHRGRGRAGSKDTKTPSHALRKLRSSPNLLPPISEDLESLEEESEADLLETHSDPEEEAGDETTQGGKSTKKLEAPPVVHLRRHRRTHSDPFIFGPTLPTITESDAPPTPSLAQPPEL